MEFRRRQCIFGNFRLFAADCSKSCLLLRTIEGEISLSQPIKKRHVRKTAAMLTVLLLLPSILAPVWAQERPAAEKMSSASGMAAPSPAAVLDSGAYNPPSANLGGIQKPPPTGDMPQGDAVALAGLLNWLENDEPEYTLTGDVVWPGGGVSAAGNRTKTLYMGGHNILVPTGKMFAAVGNYRFIGDGGAPIFTVQTGGMLKLNMDAALEVTNGCAVELEGDSPENPDQAGFSPDYGSVTAKGPQAVAVRSKGELFLDMANIRTEGGAKAVEAAGDIRLYLSVIEGAVTAGGALTIDTTGISPMPEHARVIERTARLDREAITFPLFCSAYGDGPTLPDTLSYILAAQEGEKTAEAYSTLLVDWQSGGQDITQPGIYQVAATPRPPFEGVPLACPEAEITLTVVEEGKPCLRRAFREKQTDMLELYGRVPTRWNGQVYCSEDRGESWTAWGGWTPVKHSGAIELDRQLENGKTYWFQVDVDMDGQVMRTNLIEVSVGENGLPQSRSLSGDRDDSHRGERPLRPLEDSGAGGSDSDGIRLSESADRAPAASQALPAAELASSQAQTPQSVSAKPDHGRDPACSPPAKPGGLQAGESGASASISSHPQAQSGSEALKTLSAQDSVRESGGGLKAILPMALLFCSAAAAGGAFYLWICRRKRRPKP